MKDQDKTKEQLIDELAEMRQRIAELEASETKHRRNWELTMLSRVGQEFTATLDLQQVTEQLLPAAADIIGAEGASIWLWDDAAEGWLVCRTAYHRGQKPLPINLSLGPGQGIAGWVAQKEESVIVLSAQDDPRFFPGIDERIGFRTTSLLAVPLWTRDRVIGVLEVVNKRQGDFDDDDRILAETLAASAAIAIDNARLIETLRQRTFDLQVSQRKLDALIHTLGSDLRGRLGFIVSSAQVLEEGCATLPEGEMRHYLRAIGRKGHEMVDIIDKLLVVRTEPPREIEEEIEPLDTASIVAKALERLTYLIERHQAKIILPESWPVALGYAPWVEEVWTNYLSNAIRYGGRPPCVELGFDVGGPGPAVFPSSVEALGTQAQPDGAAEQEGGTVRFWVRDNGPGVAPEEQVRLFAPGARGDRGYDAEYGLGLDLVRRIVEKLGGQMGIESEMGQGTLFFFTLPAAE